MLSLQLQLLGLQELDFDEYILQCISQLGRLLFFASGVDSDDNFLNNDTQTVATNQSSVSATLRLILYHFTSVRNKDMLKFGFLGIKGN